VHDEKVDHCAQHERDQPGHEAAARCGASGVSNIGVVVLVARVEAIRRIEHERGALLLRGLFGQPRAIRRAHRFFI
jgi:hypothetical protein